MIDVEAIAARIAERTRAEQGLPRRVEDPDVLARVAVALLREELERAGMG